MAAKARLADILGGLSIVADLGYGLPPEEAMRACLIGTAIARRLNLGDSDVATTFYATLLFHLGCVSFAHEASAVFGNENRANAVGAKTDFSNPRDILSTFIPEGTRGMPPLARAKTAAFVVTRGSAYGRRFETNNCEVARETARRIGLPESVQQALYQVHEWWNGKGAPQRLSRDEITLPARIAKIATDGVVFQRLGGQDLALQALRARAGRTLDPSIVELFARNAAAILKDANEGDPRQLILEAEPKPVVDVESSSLADLAIAFGDLADLKTPYTHGHSREVGRLAKAAAERLKLERSVTAQLHVAALLHDLGRVGITDSIWEKPGALTTAEMEQVRLHPYYSERILATSQTLAPMARIAGMHHERLDGSGYHRECRAREIPMAARVLAAADAFQAMTQARPHRAARSADHASELLTAQARAKTLDPEAVKAVLDAGGVPPARPTRPVSPAGLSDREIDVLRLVAEGSSNAEVARRLFISRRTAEHHVQHIYTKVGVSSRAAVALFALEHELLPPRA